jgi:hypothetical protein
VAEQYGAYADYVQGRRDPLDWDRAIAIQRAPFKRREAVTIRDSGEYARMTDVVQTCGGKDIYRAAVGNVWVVQSRRWWRQLATKVAVLTTEALPTRLLAAIAAEEGDVFEQWQIVELETPKLARDTVEVEFVKITARSAARVITGFRRPKGEIRVISDCAAAIPQTITHKMARGTDDLENQDIAHTMLHMNPAEHEKCEVWNAWAHLDCACRLRHIDDFNQACGRNLGFRQTGGRKHHLLISRELFRKIFELMCYHSRYDLRLHIDRNSTYELKRKVA